MIRSVIITLILIVKPLASAKIYHQNVRDDTPVFSGSSVSANHGNVEYIIGDPLWVLRLSKEEWLDSKLRLGTFEEQEDFYNVVGPMIEETQTRQASSRVKKNDPERPKNVSGHQETRSNNDLRNDIMKFINKFALSTSIEPDSYLSEDEDSNNPSIVLYFKGPVTSLIVKLGSKQWHYIVRNWPFPEWFYERHDTFEAPLSIPEDIKNKFFSALLRLLKLMLYHPL